MYKQLNHSNHEAGISFREYSSFLLSGMQRKACYLPEFIKYSKRNLCFPDQMRNHAMGFWREARFRDAVNFEGDPVHTPIWTGLRKNLLC